MVDVRGNSGKLERYFLRWPLGLNPWRLRWWLAIVLLPEETSNQYMSEIYAI